MLLLIDNFDSFTYNLAQAFQILGLEVEIIRGESLTAQQCFERSPSYIVIGPGPGSPRDYPLAKELILTCPSTIPLLGVCLGHQLLAEAYGGKIKRALKPMHGKASPIFHNQMGVFKEIPQGFLATRYHSLIVNTEKVPLLLEITAKTEEGEIMALQHKEKPHFSVQFHPESILTQYGKQLFLNFLKYI